MKINFQNYFKTICIDIWRKLIILSELCGIKRIFFAEISAIISGAVGEKFFVYNYKEEQVPDILAKHLK